MATRVMQTIEDFKALIPGDISQIKKLHKSYPLTSGFLPENMLVLPEEQIAYVASLLRDEPRPAPEISIEQWETLIEHLKINSILSFIYSKINEGPPESRPPAEAMARIKSHYFKDLREMVKVQNQLLEILDAFNAAGIRVLVLKGNAIANQFYKDPALRLGSDIDLLVMPDDVLRARKVLEGMGYNCKEKCFDISRKLYNEEAFIHSENKSYKWVEIHWNLYISCKVDIQKLFDHAVMVERGRLKFETLHPVDAITYNGLHMIMHHGDNIRLNWVIDTALLSQNIKSTKEWSLLQERSVEFGAVRPSQISLSMARLWTGLIIPPGFNEVSLWPRPGNNEMAAMSHLHIARSDLMLDKFKFLWYCAIGPVEKIQVLIYVLLPPREVMHNVFPGSSDWMLPLNYIRRLLRIIGIIIIHRGDARINTK